MSAISSIRNKTLNVSTVETTKKKSRKQKRAEKEVNGLQEQATTILPATTFKRIVTQETRRHASQPLRWNADAVKALQTASEDELTTIFTGAAFCASIAKRDTITIEDMQNFQTVRQMN
jgi:histone H3/H4|tara:strand:- start:1867 stop:2223 length:357 start_codon:yes stop_codon:yes gene_type:complete